MEIRPVEVELSHTHLRADKQDEANSGFSQFRRSVQKSYFLRAVCLFLTMRIIKANEMHCFSNLFYKVLYMFRISPLSIIRSITTLFTRNRYLLC